MEKQKRKQEPRPPLFFRIMGRIFGGLWRLVSAVFRGLGWAIGNGVKTLWRGAAWLIKLPYRLLRYLLSGRVPQFETLRQEEIFWRIKRQYRRKRFFALHLMFYVIGVLASFGISISEYFHIQDLIQRMPNYYNWNDYNQLLVSIGFGLGIWTLILVFHFIFNRMGNEEDLALGKALEAEYARSDYQEERYQRLREPIIVDEDEDYESKPKRNGAKS